APFAAALAGDAEIGGFLGPHLAAAEALAATDEETGAARLWAGEAGATAAEFLNDLAREGAALGRIAGSAYPALVATLMDEAVVRPPFGRHPRLFIWGTLEARMQHAGLVILGGLNEGTWPGQPPADPWLNRDMRKRFGLPSPDRRVGLAAHDFAQAFSAPHVVLTRATRIEGTPTVPARWLRRLDVILPSSPLEAHRALPRRAEARLLHWQDALDRPALILPGRRPRPAPPVAARPRRLSVTEIETWMRDPYAIFARRILDLEPLDPIDADANAAERGTIVHKALERFLAAFPDALPDGADDALVAIGRTAFGETLDRPGVWAFWWPRFVRIAGWVIAAERARRPGLAALYAERRAEHVIETRAGAFRLIAKVDRIERRRDGSLAIIDYKTGKPPSDKTIALGFAPQLPLEAALAALGAIAGIVAAPVATLAFWHLSGAAKPGAEVPAKGDTAALAAAAMEGLVRLITTFDDAATPYLATPDPDFAGYGTYDHLARRLEWASGEAS
ncbi:MAG: double-strand break repair protein AddB, partial [Alphaproteobacteria bacterium]|nr:double-strand break repair protein AddB [Alphaproteobacteria bacterium]